MDLMGLTDHMDHHQKEKEKDMDLMDHMDHHRKLFVQNVEKNLNFQNLHNKQLK
jgi:hypothetical protein